MYGAGALYVYAGGVAGGVGEVKYFEFYSNLYFYGS